MKQTKDGKPMNMKGWDLVHNDYYSCTRATPRGKFEITREAGMTMINVKTHRKEFRFDEASEVITVRSLFLFNRGPYLQLWREDQAVIEFDKRNIFSVDGQRDYKRSFMDKNGVWQILGDEEFFKVAVIEHVRRGHEKDIFTGFMMHVVDGANLFVDDVRMPPMAVIQQPIRPEQDMD